MKRLNQISILLIIFFSFISNTGKSQNQYAVEYSYDNAGNRILRQVVTLTEDEPGEDEVKSLAVESNIQNYHFEIFPNPSKYNLNVLIDPFFLELKNKRIEIYSLDGKILLSQNVNNENEQINLSTLSSGHYLLRLIADDFHHEWKLIKE